MIKKICSLILLAFFVKVACEEKVLILTHSYNRPDFIEWQDKTFKKFLQDDFEYVVFNDARDPKMSEQIAKVCRDRAIPCIRIPQHIHSHDNASERHQDCIHYSFDTLAFKRNQLVVMVDSDIFLVRPFSIIKFMHDYDIAALPQTRPNDVLYLWPGVVFMDMRTLPHKESMNWRGGFVNGSAVDTGGQMHHYLKNNPGLKVKFIEQISLPLPRNLLCDECSKQNNFVCVHNSALLIANGNDAQAVYKLDEKAIRFLKQKNCSPIAFLLDNCFIHYYAASWWSSNDALRTKQLESYMKDLLDEN